MSETAVRHLFVYGTLMRAATASHLGREQRTRLESEGVWRGPATVSGRLYDSGRYPLLVAAAPGDVVHGEVYELRSAADVFRWLDPYEGIPPGATAGEEYARIACEVTLADGATIAAWVYLCTIACTALPRLPDGRWRPSP